MKGPISSRFIIHISPSNRYFHTKREGEEERKEKKKNPSRKDPSPTKVFGEP